MLLVKLLICALFAAPIAAQTKSDTDPGKQHARELQALVEQLAQLKKKLATKQGKQSSAQKEFRRTEIKIGEVGAKGHQITEQQQQLDQQLQQLRSEMAELEAQQQSQRASIASHLNSAYRAGNRSALSLFFSESSPAERDRQLHYLEHINRARNERLREYNQLIERKQVVSQSIATKQNQLHDNQQLLARQYQQLTQLQQRRSALLLSLDKEIGSAREQVTELQNQHLALQALVAEMNRIQSAQRAKSVADSAAAPKVGALPDQFHAAKGKLPWPVRGERQRSFGTLRADSQIKAQGVTIAAPSGALVQAIYPGQIIFADWFGGQGLLTIVDHGEGYWSLYGHNQSLLKSVGARVSAGEAIATVGNSGGQSQPALYFEIRQQGKPSDPALWCQRS